MGAAMACPMPAPPGMSSALAACTQAARVLHAETRTPKSPWVKLLGSSHQLLFPSVPQPGEKLVQNKNVSVKRHNESERSWAPGRRGCSWPWVLCSVQSREGHPTPAGGCCGRRPASPLMTPPKYLPPWAAFPAGRCCLAQRRFETLFLKDVLVPPDRKLLVTQILNIEASPFFCNGCKTSVPRSSLGNRSFCQRNVNRTPRFLSSEVTSWLWSFSECSHGYLLLHHRKATLRASSTFQAWGSSSSGDGPSLSQVMGSSSGTKEWPKSCLPPTPQCLQGRICPPALKESQVP